MVEIRQEDSLGVGRFNMFSGASIAVATGADLVVEGTVDLRMSVWKMQRNGARLPCLALFQRFAPEA